jgi:hypothetical protein
MGRRACAPWMEEVLIVCRVPQMGRDKDHLVAIRVPHQGFFSPRIFLLNIQ